MVEIEAKKSYANFGLGRSVRQFKHALDKRRRNDEGMATLLRYVQDP